MEQARALGERDYERAQAYYARVLRPLYDTRLAPVLDDYRAYVRQAFAVGNEGALARAGRACVFVALVAGLPLVAVLMLGFVLVRAFDHLGTIADLKRRVDAGARPGERPRSRHQRHGRRTQRARSRRPTSP